VNVLSHRSEADERIAEVKNRLDETLELLFGVVLGDVEGHDKYTEEYFLKIKESFNLLLQAKHTLYKK